MSRVKVTTGSATLGSGLVFMPKNSMNCSVDMRFLTFSCAKMSAPALPRFSLPPTWSKCQCVFSRNLTGLSVSLAISAWIFGVSGANWSSITNTASSPTETPRFPPSPVIMYTVSASFSVWISTLEKSSWADAAATKSAAAQPANMRRKQVLTEVLLWLGWILLLDVFRRLGDARALRLVVVDPELRLARLEERGDLLHRLYALLLAEIVCRDAPVHPVLLEVRHVPRQHHRAALGSRTSSDWWP